MTGPAGFRSELLGEHAGDDGADQRHRQQVLRAGAFVDEPALLASPTHGTASELIPVTFAGNDRTRRNHAKYVAATAAFAAAQDSVNCFYTWHGAMP